MASRVAEADSLMKSGKKHASTSMLKWKPDWDDAATDYEKAAQIYSHSGVLDKAHEAWTKAAEAHNQAGNKFLAGKCFDNLGNLMKEKERNDDAAAAFTQAARCYALDNKPDRQSEALTRAARVSNPAQSIEFLKEGISTLEDNEKYHYTPDLYRLLISSLIRADRVAEAIPVIKQQFKAFEVLGQTGAGPKACLEVCVLTAHLGDFVLLERELSGFNARPDFSGTKEQAVANELLSALEDHNEDMLKEVTKDQTFSFLIVDIARMAKKLKLCHNAPPKKDVTGATVDPAAVEGAGGDDSGSEDSDDLR